MRNEARTNETKVRHSETEFEQLMRDFASKRCKYNKLTRASYLRIVEKVYHSLPPEVTGPLFDEIVSKQRP